MTIATFDPAQTSGDELRRSYIESGYVLVTDLMDEAVRAEITRELRRINRGDYSSSPIEGVTWRDEIEPVDWPEDDERLLGRHMYLGQPHVYSAVVRAAMTHSGICRVLEHLVGAYVPFWDGAYKSQIKRYGGRRGHRDSRIGEKRWRFGIRSERGTVRGIEVRN